MKSPQLVLAVLTLFPSLSHADVFSEYRIPAHSWQSGSANFATNGSRSQGSNDRYHESGESASFTGLLGLNALRGYDSDRVQQQWRVSASGDWRWQRSQERSEPVAGMWIEDDGRSQSPSGQASLNHGLRLYPWDAPFGGNVSSSFSAAWQESWARSDERRYSPGAPPILDDSRSSEQRYVNRYSGTLQASFGHGRIRDATVVEDVHVLEQRLLRTGALARPLSSDARERLAGLLTAATVLSQAHERPARYRWREIERVLAEDGSLRAEGLDAYSLMLANESYTMRVQRRRGHFVGPSVALSHRNDISRQASQWGTKRYVADTLSGEYHSSASSRTAYHEDGASVGLIAEWHRPVGWNWQWSAYGSLLAPVRPGESGLQSQAQLEGSWHVADRWLLAGSFLHLREYLHPGDDGGGTIYQRDEWRTSGRLGLSYFLEDRTTLNASVEDHQWHDRNEVGPGFPLVASYSHQARFSAGITYRFLGRVEAPGLFEPMSRL